MNELVYYYTDDGTDRNGYRANERNNDLLVWEFPFRDDLRLKEVKIPAAVPNNLGALIFDANPQLLSDLGITGRSLKGLTIAIFRNLYPIVIYVKKDNGQRAKDRLNEQHTFHSPEEIYEFMIERLISRYSKNEENGEGAQNGASGSPRRLVGRPRKDKEQVSQESAFTG